MQNLQSDEALIGRHRGPVSVHPAELQRWRIPLIPTWRAP